MTNVTSDPVRTTNLDGYGNGPLPWSRALALLDVGSPSPDVPFFLSTVGPDGRPHTVGIGAVWTDGALYFTSGPGARKSRHLAANPACTVAVRLAGLDLTLDGDAHRVTDEAEVARLAGVYSAGGWPATAEGDGLVAPYSAPSAGPPPWHLYRMALRAAHGVASAKPYGATRWTFARPHA
jgi:hypothetical protein